MVSDSEAEQSPSKLIDRRRGPDWLDMHDMDISEREEEVASIYTPIVWRRH